MENMNVVSEKKGILNDYVPMNETRLKTWLEEFKKTHYKNRPISNEFWKVVQKSQNLGINVESILGEEIWTYVKKINPSLV
jgi:hypothetical protein